MSNSKGSTPVGPFFVCGGFYRRQKADGKGIEEYFALVKSSGTDSLPYVTDEAHSWRLHNLCRHHAHLYRVSDDFRTLTLIREGELPNPSSLAGLRDDIRESIIKAVEVEIWMVGR